MGSVCDDEKHNSRAEHPDSNSGLSLSLTYTMSMGESCNLPTMWVRVAPCRWDFCEAPISKRCSGQCCQSMPQEVSAQEYHHPVICSFSSNLQNAYRTTHTHVLTHMHTQYISASFKGCLAVQTPCCLGSMWSLRA